MVYLNTKIVPVILIFVGVVFWSCKERDSEKPPTKIQKIVEEEEDQPDPEFAKLLDKIENVILTEYLTERDLRTISKDQRKFQMSQIDLNNDGKMEIFVNFTTSYFCGTEECSVLLLNDQLKIITEFTVMKTPIYVEETLENDWKVLMVQSEGKWRKLIFEDDSYPSNPSILEVSSNYPAKNAMILFDNDIEVLKTYSF